MLRCLQSIMQTQVKPAYPRLPSTLHSCSCSSPLCYTVGKLDCPCHMLQDVVTAHQHSLLSSHPPSQKRDRVTISRTCLAWAFSPVSGNGLSIYDMLADASMVFSVPLKWVVLGSLHSWRGLDAIPTTRHCHKWSNHSHCCSRGPHLLTFALTYETVS